MYNDKWKFIEQIGTVGEKLCLKYVLIHNTSSDKIFFFYSKKLFLGAVIFPPNYQQIKNTKN